METSFDNPKPDICPLPTHSFPPSGTELFAREDAIKKEVDSMWSSLDEDLKSDYGEVGRKRVETFMKNIRSSGVSVSSVLAFSHGNASSIYKQLSGNTRYT